MNTIMWICMAVVVGLSAVGIVGVIWEIVNRLRQRKGGAP